MRFSTSLVALAAPYLVVAAPFKRAAADDLVFTFADVLEQLESQFYTEALGKFQEADFTSAGFSSAAVAVEQFTNIQKDEATHSVTLQSALKTFGATPLTSCKFDFSSALTDVPTMLATARIVEYTGVGAYLGGATLLTDPVLLAAAGSILTVEARHQTILNILSPGSSVPSAFDIALAPAEVLAIASPFISGCDLGIAANPTLSVTNTGPIAAGTSLTFASSAINGSTDGLFCQMLIGGAATTIPLPYNQCVVPAGIDGAVAIWVTADGNALANNVRDRAPSLAGPTILFMDTNATQTLGKLARPSAGGSAAAASASGTASASTTITTSTLTPEQAASIVGSATATASAAGAAATGAISNKDNSITVNGVIGTTKTPGTPARRSLRMQMRR